MGELWFVLVMLLWTGWVVFDGAVLGAATFARWAAGSEPGLDPLHDAIGPFWEGAKVWLITAAAATALAFPQVLATGFSSLYLPVIFALWAMMIRGLAIELRHRFTEPPWPNLFDGVLQLSSWLAVLLFGAALGKVLWGFEFDADALPLWASDGQPDGVLDAGSLSTGAVAVLALGVHGMAMLLWRSAEPLASKARDFGWTLLPFTALTALVSTAYFFHGRPALLDAFLHRPLAWLFTAVALTGFVLTGLGLKRGARETVFASSTWLAGWLGAIAACSFPVLIHGATRDLTLEHHAAQLSFATVAWVIGVALVATWFSVVLKTVRQVGAATRGPGTAPGSH